MIGVMFDRDRRPEELPRFARELEAAGVDQLWVVEDLGWGGALTAAAAALAATDRITVGIGIVPAPLRNPALLAMELAVLERLHPGRLLAGIGHGVAPWMRQVGAAVGSPLTLLEETLVGVRRLLAGERVVARGRYVTIDDVQLVHPPAAVPPLLCGVMKPKSLHLSGRIADGTIVPEGTGPKAVEAALRHIDSAGPHRLIVFTHLVLTDDPTDGPTDGATDTVAWPATTSPPADAAATLQARTLPIRREFAAVHGIDESDVFLVSGSEAEAAEKISSLLAAGADSVVLRPVGPDPIGIVRRALDALGRA